MSAYGPGVSNKHQYQPAIQQNHPDSASQRAPDNPAHTYQPVMQRAQYNPAPTFQPVKQSSHQNPARTSQPIMLRVLHNPAHTSQPSMHSAHYNPAQTSQPVIQGAHYNPAHKSQPLMHSAHQKPVRTSQPVMHTGVAAQSQNPVNENNDCFRVVQSMKYVEIPCTRNVTQRFKVRVPRQVTDRVPRRVPYVEYVTREREEPYHVKRMVIAYRQEDREYTIQVPKKVSKMVKVTKKVPKTVYVDVIVEEPREETIMVPETRTRKVKVPYEKEVLDRKFMTVKESIPVPKVRTEYNTVSKTIYEDSWKTEMVPVTKMVHKEIPVFNIVPNDDCAGCTQAVPGHQHYSQTSGGPHPVAVEEKKNQPHWGKRQPTPEHYKNPNTKYPQQEHTTAPDYSKQPGAINHPQTSPVRHFEPVMQHPETSNHPEPAEMKHPQGPATSMQPAPKMTHQMANPMVNYGYGPMTNHPAPNPGNTEHPF